MTQAVLLLKLGTRTVQKCYFVFTQYQGQKLNDVFASYTHLASPHAENYSWKDPQLLPYYL